MDTAVKKRFLNAATVAEREVNKFSKGPDRDKL